MCRHLTTPQIWMLDTSKREGLGTCTDLPMSKKDQVRNVKEKTFQKTIRLDDGTKLRLVRRRKKIEIYQVW